MSPDAHGLREVIRGALHRRVSANHKGYFAFGWLILMLFLVQIVTGILLSFYYESSPEMAYESLKFIMRDVDAGWLIRGVHHWAAHGMIALGLLQLIRIFATAAYKLANRWSWYLGIVLLFLTFAFALTGSLLAWDQRAYWSSVSAMRWIAAVPVVGNALVLILGGGAEVGPSTLSRFYSIHTLLLPWIAFYLLLLHLWLMSRSRAGQDEGSGRPFYPYHFINWCIAALLLVAVLALLSGFLPPGLGQSIDLEHPPALLAPEWYFRGLDQFLGMFPDRWVGLALLLVGLSWVVVFYLPRLDRSAGRRPSERRLVLAIGVLVVVGALYLTLRGL